MPAASAATGACMLQLPAETAAAGLADSALSSAHPSEQSGHLFAQSSGAELCDPAVLACSSSSVARTSIASIKQILCGTVHFACSAENTYGTIEWMECAEYNM